MSGSPRTASGFRAGIDEAGRGPVLGPLVLACVWLDRTGARALRRAGVRDSKQFGAGERARAERSRLARLVREHARAVAVEAVPPAEVDAWVRRGGGGLDALERTVALRLLAGSPPARRIVADGRLFAPLEQRVRGLRAESRADSRFVEVAAASIVAKDLRDRLFLEQADGHGGELARLCVHGMGYANASTLRFIRAYTRARGQLPPETRLTWRWPPLRELLAHDSPADRDVARASVPQLLLF